MKKLILFFAVMGLTTSVFADQKATIKCSGNEVTLTEKSPYLGEDSKYSQSLLVLNLSGRDESSYTAYFLDVALENDVDANSMIYSEGKNNKGGTFTLKTKFWNNVGDGTIISEETTGLLTYKHGTLKGKDVAVKCVRN